MNLEHIVILVTTASSDEARSIGNALVQQGLAACVNVLPGISSLFVWEGKTDRADEVLLIIKSKSDVFEEVVSLVKKMHSYEVPEIIALPIVAGYRPYLDWITEAVKSKCK
jgi:periplasmic divalent cation tolerance protein